MSRRLITVLLGAASTASVLAAAWLLIQSIGVEATEIEKAANGDASLYGVGYIVIAVLLAPPGLMLLSSTLLGLFAPTQRASSIVAVAASVVVVPLAAWMFTWGDSNPGVRIPADALAHINRLIDIGQYLLVAAALLAVAHAVVSRRISRASP